MPHPSATNAYGHRGCYTLVVLGGGIAAVAAAREAARRGTRVALLLPDEVAGDPLAEGDSLDFRDTPAVGLEGASSSANTGPSPPPSSGPVDFTQTIRLYQARLGLLAPPVPVDEPRIDVFRGPVRFSRYRTVSAGGVDLRFRKAVVATGSRPGPTAMAGADAATPLCPNEMHRLKTLPERLAVIGSDGRACFWAQHLQRLGSEVHLVATQPRLLEASDDLAVQIVCRQLQADGVTVHMGGDEIVLDRTGNRRGVLIRRGKQYEKLLVDEVLVCAPPRPDLAQLALETAAVGYDERGIGVDDWLRTSEPRIFAAGGACGPGFASPEAEEGTGRLAARNALTWRPRRLSRFVIPRCIPTDPPMVEIGSSPVPSAGSESDAERRCIEFCQTYPPGEGGCRHGCIAVDVDRRGRLIRGTIAAIGAEELAIPLMLLMERRWPIDALGELTPCRSGLASLLVVLARK